MGRGVMPIQSWEKARGVLRKEDTTNKSPSNENNHQKSLTRQDHKYTDKKDRRKVGTRMELMKCVQYKDKRTNEVSTAILHSYNKNIFMFLVVRESAIDGIEYVNRRHVKKLTSKSRYSKFINKCLDNRLIRIPNIEGVIEGVKLRDILKAQKGIIGVDTIYKEEIIFLVGRVGNFEKKSFEIECVDMHGKVDNFNYQFKYSEIARVAIGGNYLKMPNKWSRVVQFIQK